MIEQIIDRLELLIEENIRNCGEENSLMCHDRNFGVIQAIECIKKMEKQQKADWIPCEVDMPKEEMEVWVTHENGKVLRHYWYNGKFVQNYPLDEPRPYPKAIAWMPCIKPQPYKKEGAENERIYRV